MRRWIIALGAGALLAATAPTLQVQASPLMPVAPLAAAVPADSGITPVRWYRGHRHHYRYGGYYHPRRHYGWYHHRHYGWYHPHRRYY